MSRKEQGLGHGGSVSRVVGGGQGLGDQGHRRPSVSRCRICGLGTHYTALGHIPQKRVIRFK